MRFLLQLVLCVNLMGPLQVLAADALKETKDPLSYSLRQYGFMLAISLLGGLVGWHGKVRKGELMARNLSALVGELATSAFSGLLAFWFCEYMDLQRVLTAAVVGIAGHMGTRAITYAEAVLQKRAGLPEPPKQEPPA